jgi:hypothetical protein
MRYKFEPLNTLAAIFGAIEDPRDERGKRHKLLDAFILTVFGLLWGHTDFTNMAIEPNTMRHISRRCWVWQMGCRRTTRSAPHSAS